MSNQSSIICVLLVDISSSIKDAMSVISENGKGICFITEKNKLVGTLSDGDIRRYLIHNPDTSCSVEMVMNRNCISLPYDATSDEIRTAFTAELRLIPLLNKSGEVIDVADARSNHKIPVLQPSLQGNELRYVSECIESNWISSQGKYVTRFEKDFRLMHYGYFSLAVCNGTAALHLALLSLGIGSGDEVIVPDLTFAASINSILHAGAVPVLCEIEKESFCINTEEAEKLITSKTKAIMPVHLYGHPCDMDQIMQLARTHNLFVVEDCAEALGTEWKNQRVGTFGDVSTFSFFGNKTISTGEGGMVLFKDRRNFDLAKKLRDHGMNPEKRYWHDVIGYNYRMTNLQAAVGVAQLEQFDEILSKKLQIRKWYLSLLAEKLNTMELPKAPNNSALHSNWLFTIVLNRKFNRERIIDALMEYGIETRQVFYSMHLMPPYKNLKTSDSLEFSELISNFGLSLPSSASLTHLEVKYICKSLLEVLETQEELDN